METTEFGNTKQRSAFFYIAMGIIAACMLLSVNTDLAENAQHRQLNIPQWFFSLIFTVDGLMAAALLLIILYRKIGVIAFPVLVLVHFLLHNFYLSTMLYSDLNLLFAYSSAGLLAVIPRWNHFRWI